jgi:hypothetical protein
MSIRAILKDGQIRLSEPLPATWVDGLELTVQVSAAAAPVEVAATEVPASEAELDAWEAEIERSAAAIPAEEHRRFLAAIEEHEAWSKRAVRKEWGLE